MRDTSKTPGSALLDGGVLGLGKSVHNLVLLDKGNLEANVSAKLSGVGGLEGIQAAA